MCRSVGPFGVDVRMPVRIFLTWPGDSFEPETMLLRAVRSPVPVVRRSRRLLHRLVHQGRALPDVRSALASWRRRLRTGRCGDRSDHHARSAGAWHSGWRRRSPGRRSPWCRCSRCSFPLRCCCRSLTIRLSYTMWQALDLTMRPVDVEDFDAAFVSTASVASDERPATPPTEHRSGPGGPIAAPGAR